MANHKSAEKRARQTIGRNQRNRSYLSQVKTAVKGLRTLVQAGTSKVEDLQKQFAQVQSILQKAAAKGVVHKNNASRRIQRLAHLISSPK